MSDYPEHDKQAKVVEQTQVIGGFLEWLNGEGVQLMVYREDLSVIYPTGPECRVSFNSDDPQPCDQIRAEDDDRKPRAWWRRHCKHWQHPDREATGAAGGTCCRCGKGQDHEGHVPGWIHDGRSIERLLADWAGIDLSKIEAEKRQMLASLRAMNGG